MNNLIDHYTLYNEDIRLEKDNAHKTEFITTTYFLDKFIKKSSKILDVGAATGRYSFYYAERDNKVTAVDLCPSNIDILKRKWELCSFKHNLSYTLGDARDLSDYENSSFDTVLCMGPIYHLGSIEEKRRCITECLRVLKPGGILAIAYINKFAVCASEIKKNKDILYGSNLDNIIKTGIQFGDERDIFYFTSPQEVESIMNEFHVEKLENVGTDGISYLIADVINQYTEEEYNLWIQHHLNTCTEESILGYSLHGLYICRKVS